MPVSVSREEKNGEKGCVCLVALLVPSPLNGTPHPISKRRHYDDKVAEAEQGFWNCPCVPMRERKVCVCV